eukprot:190388_1
MEELSEAIELHYARTRPTKESKSAQQRVFNYIERCTGYLQTSESDGSNMKRILKGTSPVFIEKSTFSVFVFGSKSDGTSSPASDIDIGVYLNFKVSRSHKRGLLLKLSQIVSKHDPSRSLLVKCLLRARYPIIKIYDFESRDTINVSIADCFCFQRNELIKRYIAHHTATVSKVLPAEDCINKLIVFIKHWSKARGINNAYAGYLNSFGFVVLIIKFIQWFELRKLRKNKKRKWNLAEILIEFYSFYVIKFDWSVHCVSIARRFTEDDYKDRDGMIFDYKLNPYIALQIIDPMNVKNNVAKNVNVSRTQHIKYEFIRAVQICESNKDGLFRKLCDTNTDLVENCEVQFDVDGNLHVDYNNFEFSYKRGKDTRYQTDPNAKYVLTALPK